MRKLVIALVVVLAVILAWGIAASRGTETLRFFYEEPVTIFAVGDIMLDRNVRKNIDTNGPEYPFEEVASLFKGHDIVVGNLEGGFTDNESIAMRDNSILRFTFDPSYAPYLRSLGFDTLSLANNHAADFGGTGMAQNKEHLKRNGFRYFGSPSNDSDLSVVREVRDKKIAFVGYHEFYAPSTDSVVDEISSLRPVVDFIVVYPHWGEEYLPGFTEGQQRRARAFIDAGADAVVGAHPHVIEPVEIYNGKAIFYSLGNFIFDQDFSSATRQGLALKIDILDESVSYELVPVTMRRSRLSIPDDAERRDILESLAERSSVSDEHKSGILSGKLLLPRRK